MITLDSLVLQTCMSSHFSALFSRATRFSESGQKSQKSTAVSNRQNGNYETPQNRGVQKTIFGIQDSLWK